MSEKYPNSGKKWSPEDGRKLERLAESGMFWREIGKELGRSPRACSRKYRELTGSAYPWISTPEERIEIKRAPSTFKDALFDRDREKFQTIALQRCGGKNQRCAYCGMPMTGNYGLTIGKSTEYSHYNVWIHSYCIEPFLKLIRRTLEEHGSFLRKKMARDAAKNLTEPGNPAD